MNQNQKIVPFLILCLLQVGDLISTRMAMTVPGVRELNPLVRELGLTGAKLLAFGIIVLFVWRAKSIGRVWAACGVYAAVVASNALLFLKS